MGSVSQAQLNRVGLSELRPSSVEPND